MISSASARQISALMAMNAMNFLAKLAQSLQNIYAMIKHAGNTLNMALCRHKSPKNSKINIRIHKVIFSFL